MGNCKCFIAVICFHLCFFNVSPVRIENNAYKDISISISENVKEQDFEFEKLKTVLTKASEFIYHATKKRSYFGDFTISLPSSWKSQMCTKSKRATFKKVDIHLINSNGESYLRAKHSKGCGSEGDMIRMSSEWLRSADVADLAHQFVQQWSIYRYGIFEEEPIKEGSCHMSGNSWTPVGCYNTQFRSEATLENGLPVCLLPTDFFEKNEIQSSLMSIKNSSKALHFCDGSSSFPHNAAMPTLHNNLCKGKNVWSVIEESNDFEHGRNWPMTSDTPPSSPDFTCFQEETMHLTFVFQSNTVQEDLSNTMTQLGSSLYEFLWYLMPKNSKVNLVRFSDDEDTSQPLELDVKNSEKLSMAIEDYVATKKIIQNTCLLCGFQKALNATPESASSPIIVLMAWESSLLGEKGSASVIVESIKKYPDNVRLHLLLVEDMKAEVLPMDVNLAIKSLGGVIYSLPKELVFMASKLQAILAGIVKNPLQVEDRIVVVHEGNYRNIKNDFLDFFVTPSAGFSQMIYRMYCDPTRNSVIKSGNPNCTLFGKSVSLLKCGEIATFKEQKMTMKSWRYKFLYENSTQPLHCSSVAVLIASPSSSSVNSFTLRGWLSEDVINVHQNTLVIYAEVVGASKRKFKVQAQIFGPGLKSPSVIDLRDNGNGDPDVKAGDGIYSRYFTSFSQKGAYTVSISAELLTNDNKHFFVEGNQEQIPNLQQKKEIGYFSVVGLIPNIDILPPNRVADLRVVSVNHDNRTVILQWTAPGGDYDSGEATAYEIKYSRQPSSLSDLYFNGEENYLLEPVHNQTPQVNGEMEFFEFQFDETDDNGIYYVALRAVDANNNKGDISNTIQIYLNRSRNGIKEFSSTEITKLTSEHYSTSPKNEKITDNVTDATTPLPEIKSTTDENNVTTIAPQSKTDEFFDEKTIIILSSTGGIFLLIIIINIIVCFCCIKKRKRKTNSRRTSLRPPYNLNIAYHEDSNSSTLDANCPRVSMSSLVDSTGYSDLQAKNTAMPQSYTYHTAKSLQNKAKKDSELGFKLVQASPAYATSSLSRYVSRLREADTESETELKSALPQPQAPTAIRDAQIYPLGVV